MKKETFGTRLISSGNGRIPFLSPILITLFALPALRPLMSRQLTCGFDNVFHLWRAVEIGALIREGIWFSRWAPHMAHGFGYPLYLYQSPLSAYLVALLNIAGFSWATAVHLVYGLGLLGSGFATWWLAREFWGEQGGLLSAVAIMFTPFHLYVVYYRASLSETVAWIFPPLVLWGIYRWQVRGQPVGLFTAVFSQLLLFYTHDVTGYIFFPLFLLWPVGLGWAFESQKRAWHGITAVLLSFASAAFFWLPAILERDLIQFGRAGSAWPFLPQNNYLPLSNLFALPRNADPLLLNDWPERGIGLLVLILIILGVWFGWRKKGALRRLTAVFTLFFLGYLFLVTPLASFLWDNIDILAAFQFPWRFLSPVVLMGSLLIGGLGSRDWGLGIGDWGLGRYSLFTFYVSLAILPLLHFGWLSPNHCALPSNLTVEGMVDWERGTGTLGTTASRELLPTTVERLPQTDEGQYVWQNRLHADSLPNGAAVEPIKISTMDATYDIEASQGFTAVYQAFAFPGWRATLNGDGVDITPSETNGLITVDIPAGQTQLRIYRSNTAVQTWGILLSVAAVLGAVGWGYWGLGIGDWGLERVHHSSFTVDHPLLAVLLTVGLFLLSFTSLFNQTRLENGRLSTASIQSTLTFGHPANPNQVRLLGHDLLPNELAADSPLEMTLYWEALAQLPRPYRVGVTAVDEQGIRWSEEGLRDYRWTRSAPPTQQWPVGQYAQTAFFLDLLPGTPPGQYDLQLTFFDEETLAPLTIFQDGNPLGPAVSLGKLTIVEPKRPLAPQTIGGEFKQLNELSYRLLVDREQAIPGDSVLMTLFAQSEVDINAEIVLLDSQNQPAAIYPLSLTASARSVQRHQQLLRLPASMQSGAYQWQLSIDDETAVVGTLGVNAPERIFDPPEVDISVEAPLGNQATLVGASLSNRDLVESAQFDITLVWQSTQEIETSYRVFVQMLDSNNQIIAQSDGLPANWTRPTTGWQAGEYITDRHTLNLPDSLPADEYVLIVGLYTLENGRLLTPTGTDAIIIPITNNQ
ncbi:MAG: hypothetical protein AAF490_07150 [Chloroflexota bacterium]